MNKLLLAALALVAAACGSGTVDGPGTTIVERPDVTTAETLPGATQAELLAAARLDWTANRPDSYELTYQLICECDSGPWLIRVEGDETVLATRTGLRQDGDVPYLSVEAIFANIEEALAAGEVPVDVEYDQDFGYPRNYIYNGPGLPRDAGVIVDVTEFQPDPPPGDVQQRRAFVNALVRWEESGLADSDYDYDFTRNCFCPREFTGPYQASARAGQVAFASLDGVDLYDIEMLEIARYDELVLSVEGVFTEIERALRTADSLTAEYHPTLGYPTTVFIDWDFRTADEEIGYVIDRLTEPIDYPETCSTSGWEVSLTPQPDLPGPVAATREALFAAAISCDFAGLVAISALGELPVETSFGGSGPEYFADREREGIPAMRWLAEHLNLAYAGPESGGNAYVWPSAFHLLTSPYGDGIPAEDYAALLELYSVEALEESFDFFGGYAGYRVVIDATGDWLFAIAGD